MGIEIEAKMRVADLAVVESRLIELGAERGPVIDEVNEFYDTVDSDLLGAGQGLRVRRERHDGQTTPIVIMTHKGPRQAGELKSRQETQLKVESAESAGELLAVLGYERRLQFEKRRRRWRLDDCLVELDQIARLGTFVEIEGPSESAVLKVRQRLGLDGEPLIQQSYAEMFAAV